MSKQSIPAPKVADPALQRTLNALKQNVDQIGGNLGGVKVSEVKKLGGSWTIEQVVDKLNETIEELNNVIKRID